jgi:hypothetical protein
VHVIPVEKLDYVEAQDDYVALKSDKKTYLKQQTISSLETMLDPGAVHPHPSFAHRESGAGGQDRGVHQGQQNRGAARRHATCRSAGRGYAS